MKRLLGTLLLAFAGSAFAQEAASNEVAFAFDTFALLIAALLVILMQPGFALLEAGLTSAKNTINIFMKNYADFAVAGLAYWAVGFWVMYGGGQSAFLSGYETGMNVPPIADFFFQLVFAATAATIVSGAIAGRMKFSGYLIFSIVMTALIYPYLGGWKWGGGWLDAQGFQDFAGSSIVHAVGGFAALGAVVALGPRLGRYTNGRVNAMPGHNMALAGLGVFLLWIGWFGFNGGSQLAFSSQADAEAIANIFLNTNLAASTGALSALIVSWIMFGKPDFSMTINGVLAGLVSITAGCDVIIGLSAVATGAIGGAIVVFSVVMFDSIRIDDPVGAISVHGVVGIWGTVAVGIFGGANLLVQLYGALAYAGAAFVAGLVLFYILKAIGLLRVTPNQELRGLDIVEHGAEAYGSGNNIGDSVVIGKSAAGD